MGLGKCLPMSELAEREGFSPTHASSGFQGWLENLYTEFADSLETSMNSKETK